jgi:hypothetical protein
VGNERLKILGNSIVLKFKFLRMKMNPKLDTSLNVMKSIERTLLIFFGFLVIRKINPAWLSNTEIFMPVALLISTALYIIYTVLLTGLTVLLTILLLICGIGGNSEKFIELSLKDMTIDKIESLKIEWSIGVRIRIAIEDILMVYFSWMLDKHYLAILVVITIVESRWFLSVLSQIADKLKTRFYNNLQKEAGKKERVEFEKDYE